MKRRIGLACLAWAVTFAGSSADEEQLAGVALQRAADYLAAVLMGQEFRRSACGANQPFDDAMVDLERAKSEVVAAFPPEVDFRAAFEALEAKRPEFRAMFSAPGMVADCGQTAKSFWNTFNTAVSAWREVKPRIRGVGRRVASARGRAR